MLKIQNFINGELIQPNSGDYFDNSSPATGKVYSQTPDSDKADIDNAVASAKEAFKTWSKLPQKERYDHIMRLALNPNFLLKLHFLYGEII